MLQYIKTVVQVAILAGISLLGNGLSSYFQLGIPGNILGLLILFVLMERKLIALQWVEAGADFLIAELLLFFIPSAIGVMRYKSLFEAELGNLLLVIVASILAVLVFVGAAAELVGRCRRERTDQA